MRKKKSARQLYELRLASRAGTRPYPDFRFMVPGPSYIFGVEAVEPCGAIASFRIGQRAIRSGDQIRAGEEIIAESVGGIAVQSVIISLEETKE